ncbi:MAG TPA: efflux RND transporter periplasmic adaptor subunit [Flavobacterium sp.]|nr:efflux RND transporter periplasmic adaptor subunit [Flavobacterium sp.]HPJ10405.1 efflux RND transporter periplasmic adaptor subunit [Flavobacterium sp.]
MKRIILLCLLLSLLACKDKLTSIKPIVAPISESIYASGNLKSKNQYEAFAPVSGIVDSVYVSEGDMVKKGEAILSISNQVQLLNQENAALAADLADIAANRGKLKEAKLLTDLSRNKMLQDSLMYFRQKNLWQQQIGSKVALEQQALAYQNAKTAYVSAVVAYNDLKRQLAFNAAQSKKNLQISGKLTDDYMLRSETDGMVYRIDKKKGEIMSPQMALATIGHASGFILELQVDEYDIFKVHKGLAVLVTLDGYKEKVFRATVTKINPFMNGRSRTFLVEAEFADPPARLYPNISLEANIVLSAKPKALLVPRNYVLGDSMVTKSNGEKVIVKTGLRDYQKIEILSGITQSDELIPPTP